MCARGGGGGEFRLANVALLRGLDVYVNKGRIHRWVFISSPFFVLFFFSLSSGVLFSKH